LARREAKAVLAPYVSALSRWNQRAARLSLALGRPSHKQNVAELPIDEIQALIDEVEGQRRLMTESAKGLTSTRVDDLQRSFERLLAQLNTLLGQYRELAR
jgi:HAMP domain-containing protein